MKNLFTSFLLILLIYGLQFCQKISEAGTNEFKSIFNEKNLEGWHTQGKILTNIENGILTLSNDQSGQGGWLLSDRKYENFQLKFEFLCPPPNNSGVTIRYNNPQEGDPALSAYEINIFNTPNTQNPTGSIQNLARSFWSDSLLPMDWNQMEIIAKGDCLVTKINGEKLLVSHQRRTFNGHIGFQANEGKIRHGIQLRNIYLKRLPPEEITGPLIEDYMRSNSGVRTESLLDINNMSNWEVVGDGQWTVSEDELIAKTDQDDFSFMKTQKTYHNFYLKLKFRIEKDHNSGVFIRQDPQKEEISLESGLEINIYDHDGFTYAWPTGSVVTKARAFIGIVDYDDWNTMEIFAFNHHICTYVNGLKTSDYYTMDSFNRPGNICLQVGVQVATEERGGSEVRFKDIEIKDFSEIPFIGY